MVYKIVMSPEFFDQINSVKKELLKQISPSKKKIYYYIQEGTGNIGKVEKDLCNIINYLVENGKLNTKEKAIIKTHYSLNFKKALVPKVTVEGVFSYYEELKNLNSYGDLEKTCSITNLSKKEVEKTILKTIKKIKEYNFKFDQISKQGNKTEVIYSL